MRITDLHVDGFGVLCDWEATDLPRGLVVIHGPNEAGKSTLLDFVRGTLFGFPDRRHRRPMHPPLRGGRHGGTIRIADNDDQHWTISRHNDAGRLEIVAPDGSAADPAELDRLLGGADDKLFNAIFAFGLSELATFDSLDSDEVRDRVFSAGVLGAGRSATRAAKALEERQGILVRPRHDDPRANQLRSRITDIEEALQDARDASEHYQQDAASCDLLQDRTNSALQVVERLRGRAIELDKLTEWWPIWHRGEQAKQDLASLGQGDEPILALEEEIAVLTNGLGANTLRMQDRSELADQLAGVERSIATQLRTLGDGIDETSLKSVALGVEVTDRALTMAQRAHELQAELRATETEMERIEGDVAAATARQEQALGDQDVADGRTLEQRDASLSELRRLVVELEHSDQVLMIASQQGALSSSLAHRRRTGTSLVAIATACVVVLVAAAVVLAYRHHLTEALVALVGAFGVVAVATLRRPSATEAERHKHYRSTAPDTTNAARIADLAVKVGLVNSPSVEDIDGARSIWSIDRARRSDLDELARLTERARDELARCQARLEQRGGALRELHLAAETEARRLGFGHLSPDGLVAAVEALQKISETIDARERITVGLDGYDSTIDAFCARLGFACTSLGLAVDDTPSADEIAASVANLESQLVAVRARRDKRLQAETTVAQTTTDLFEAFGEGDDARRLFGELHDGAVMQWEVDRERLNEEIAAATAQAQELSDALRDEKRGLEELVRSSVVADLEIELASLESDLDAVLAEWAALGFAQALLTGTLARYEQDRQPVVISKAAGLFATITEGRYVNLVAHEDEDGRHHGITALTKSGQRVDAIELSRGTAEQLYLCLRLAFAATFAERAVSLPLVLDDVLVNFDPARAAGIAAAIKATAEDHQVLAFTCHPHVVGYFRELDHDVRVIELDRSASA